MVNSIFLLPSFYGALAWFFLLSIIGLFDVGVFISEKAFWVIIYASISQLLVGFSVLYFWTKTVKPVQCEFIKDISFEWKIFNIFSFVGIGGLLLYVYDFSGYLGGFGNFVYYLVYEPLVIRAAAAEDTSLGFQLSYISWCALFYGFSFFAFNYQMSGWRRLFVAGVILIIFLLNLSFIDRTRPVILFLVCAFIYLFSRLNSGRSFAIFLSFILTGPFLIFIVMALITEKFDAEVGLLGNLSVYIFGGFGYLSELLNNEVSDFTLARTFYPLAKFLVVLGFDIDVPSQILEFKSVPYLTNVGTFLEPLYSDGGLFFLVVSMPILFLTLDYIALKALTSLTISGVMLWSNIVVSSLFGFFVPKYSSPYFYVICAVHLIVSFFIFSRIRIR